MPLRACLVLLSSVLALGACTGGSAPGCAAVTGQRERVLAAPDVGEATTGNVVLLVRSDSRTSRAVTVRADHTVLLSVQVPAARDRCAGEVFEHRYRLPDRPVTVQAHDGQQRDSVRVTLTEQRQWVSVLLPEGYPVDLAVWPGRPRFG